MEVIGAAQSGCEGCDVISRTLEPFADLLDVPDNVVRFMSLRHRNEERFLTGSMSAIAAITVGPIALLQRTC
jgi:hypothetical protein